VAESEKTREELEREIEELRQRLSVVESKIMESSGSGDASRFHDFFQKAHDAILVINPERDEILEANQSARKLLGYSLEELRSLPISAIHPNEMDAFRAFARTVEDNGHGWTDQLHCLKKSGESVAAEIAASVISCDGESNLLCSFRDRSAGEGVEDGIKSVHQRMKRDLNAASRIQKSLLPTQIPEFPGARFAWCFSPCEELAGDNLNVLQVDDDHVALYVLDVSGHGVPAALLAVTLHQVLSSLSDHSTWIRKPKTDGSGYEAVPPAQVAERLNREFSMNMESRQYFTILYGVLNLETREFRFVSGGHWGPILVPSEGEARLLHARGFPIGVFEDTTYEENVVHLAKGDRLYLYSDGIPEALNADGEQFDYQRIAESLNSCRKVPLSACLDQLLQRVELWRGKLPQDDDISLLALEMI